MEQESLHELTKELGAIFLTKPIEEMLALYLEFSEMETDAQTGVASDWLDNVAAFYYPSGSKRASHSHLLNCESFLKKILYIVDRTNYDLCDADPKKAFSFVAEKLGLQDLFDSNNEMFHYNEEKDRLTKYDLGKMSKEEQKKALERQALRKSIALAYTRRNNTAHTSKDWSGTEMQANINAVMATTVYAVWKHRNVLRQKVSATTSNNEYDIDTQMSALVRAYDRKGFQYVSLLWECSDTNQSQDMQLDKLLVDKQILLSGDAGCGKTTALDELEYQAAKKYLAGQTSVIPVKLALILQQPTLTLEEMICQKLNIPSDYCKKLLQRKHILLLIDGLNELTTDSAIKSKFVIALEQFVENHPGINLIVTDRRYSPFPIRLKKTYQLKPLDKQDILRYAESRPEYHEAVPELLAKLLDMPSFVELEYTPLLINQLLLALSTRKTLPEDLSDLTGIYLEALLDREYNEKRDLNAAPGKLDLCLMKLASEMNLGESIPLYTALKHCTKIMTEHGVHADSHALVNLAVQLGILQQTDGFISFILDNYHTYYLLQAVKNNL